jgi:hypothetical protein
MVSKQTKVIRLGSTEGCIDQALFSDQATKTVIIRGRNTREDVRQQMNEIYWVAVALLLVNIINHAVDKKMLTALKFHHIINTLLLVMLVLKH